MLLESFGIGGAETHVLYLAQGLRQLGVDVVVTGLTGPLAAEFLERRFPCHFLNLPGGTQTGWTDNLARELQQLCHKHEIDLIHNHMTGTLATGALAIRRTGLPTVVSAHGTFFDRVAFAFADANARIAHCRTLANYVSDLAPGQPVHLIENGIDLSLYTPATPAATAAIRTRLGLPVAAPVILYASRLAQSKWDAAASLLGTCVSLTDEFPDLRYLIAGPLGERVQPFLDLVLAAQKRAPGLVQYLGQQRHLADHMQAADLVVGGSKVAQEAMACGRPVLAVGFRGTSGPVTTENLETLVDENFGDYGASEPFQPAVLARHLRPLLTDPAQRAHLGTWGHAVASARFGYLRMAEKTLAVYRQVLGN